MASISGTRALAQARYNQLAKKYGEDPEKLRLAGTATLIGADIVDGYSTYVNESLRAEAIKRRQDEIGERAEISLLNIAKQEKKVVAAQAGAFQKSGVKLEGSALNVLSQTVNEATEAKLMKQREASFEQSKLEVERVLSERKAENAMLDTLFAIGNSAAYGYTK
jgi:hypothetical protein